MKPSMDNLQLMNEASEKMEQHKISGEASGMDDGPRIEGCSIQEEKPCDRSVDPELRIPETETSASLNPVALKALPPVPLQQCPFRISVGDMDCLICFHRFSLTRLPKVLACQHAFCTLCLKLILRQEDHTWIISCPLCRKATMVFGGLICSLPNQEHVMERLGSPVPDPEIAGTLGTASVCHSQHPSPAMQSQDIRDINQAAAKRFILLLLLASLLIVLILPFTSTGLLMWFLCFIVVVGTIISIVLCWDPTWTHPSFLMPSCTKVNQVA